jgi:DNA-binding IclR family transcriptional regulator
MASKRGPKLTSRQLAEHSVLMSSLSAAAVLSFLKETRGMPSWNLKDLTKSLRISAAGAKRATALLEVQGYIDHRRRRVVDDCFGQYRLRLAVTALHA